MGKRGPSGPLFFFASCHPGHLAENGFDAGSPGLWGGAAALPRHAAQAKAVLKVLCGELQQTNGEVALLRIQWRGGDGSLV